jgi:hypothetical protein
MQHPNTPSSGLIGHTKIPPGHLLMGARPRGPMVISGEEPDFELTSACTALGMQVRSPDAGHELELPQLWLNEEGRSMVRGCDSLLQPKGVRPTLGSGVHCFSV